MSSKEIEQVLLKDKIPTSRIDKKKLANELSDKIVDLNSDRKEWIDRQEEYLLNWDDYVSELTTGPWENSANFHLPITMIHAQAQHSRLLSSIFGINPWFNVVPREKLDATRIKRIDQLMRFSLTSYFNSFKGIYLTIDDWLWDIVTVGWGVMKMRWDVQYRKSQLVEKMPLIDFDTTGMSDEEIDQEIVKRFQSGQLEMQDVEKDKFLKIFDGPVLETIECEDILFPGYIQDASDLDQAHIVAHRLHMTAHELKVHSARGLFDARGVNKIIKMEPDDTFNTRGIISDTIKKTRDEMRGVDTVDAKEKPESYTIHEIYTRYDVDNDGFDEEIIVWLHDTTNTVLRWTYLDRVCPDGRRPFFKGDLIRRPRSAYSMGLVELLYPINKEADAIHNQTIDAGTLINTPFGFYRSSSGIKPELIEVGPGKLYPVEDVNDIRIPHFPQSTNFGMQYEQSLKGYASEITSITSMATGQTPSPIGGARTATGMLTMQDQANKQLNVRIKRVQNTFSRFLKAAHSLLVERMPLGMQYRVLTEDGQGTYDSQGSPVMAEFNDRFELMANVDFELLANSENTNRELEKQNAMLLSQLLKNPMNLQLGIVGPHNVYNIDKNVLEKHGILECDKFLTKPQDVEQPLSLYDEIQSAVQGLMPKIVMNDDHQGKVAGLQQYLATPEHQEAMQQGYMHPNHMAIFQAIMQKHMQLQQVMMQQQQMGNITGLQISPSLGARQGGQVEQQTGKPVAEQQGPPQQQQPQQQQQPPQK